MKLNKWLYGAAALAMLAACSDKDIAPNGGGGENGGNNPGEVVSGYIAVQINLPQETGTRAEGEYQAGTNPDQTHPGLNDVFKDGEAYEYKVDNALIILFKGVTDNDGKDKGEKNAVYYRSQELTKPFFENSPEDDNITSSYIAAIPVEATLSDNIYALVVLNRNKQTFVLENNGNLTIAGNSVTKGTTKFEDLLNFTTTNSFINVGEDGSYSRFFMANAPLSTTIGGQGGDPDKLGATPAPVNYLVNLGNEIYDTEADAKANVHNCIYVERAMAKVTYQNGKFDNSAIKFKPVDQDENASAYDNSGFTIMGVDDEGNNIKVTARITAEVDYNLTHTNNISYVIRNVELDDHFNWGLNCRNEHNVTEYRMVSGTAMPKLNSPFHEEPKNLYRTYWCKDPNYGEDMGANRKDFVIADGFKSLSSPLYCKENTFNVANQKYGNTTLALFRMNYTVEYDVEKADGTTETIEADNLYTRGGDNSTVYISKRSAAAEEITRIAKNPHIRAAMAKCVKSGVTNTTYSVTDHIEIETEVKDITTEEGKVLPSQLWITGIKLKLPLNADGTDVVADNWFDKESVKKFAEIIGNITGTAQSKYDVDGNDLGVDEDGNQIYSTPQTQKELVGAANLLNDITVYKDGVSYYAIPIKHFGDHYTPWKNIQGTTTDKVYNNGEAFSATDLDHAKKYLGRYGMVRNNWYELNISEVRSLGFAAIPNIDDELSDDNLEVKKYIGLEIHILSWAKRNQSIKF